MRLAIEIGYRLSRNSGLQVVYNRKADSHMVRTLDFDTFCRRCYLQGRSNWVVNQLHPGRAASTWAQVEGVAEEWERIRPGYDLIMKMSRDLDRLALERMGTDGPLDEIDTSLLYRAYGAAFDANRIKGTAAMALEEDRT